LVSNAIDRAATMAVFVGNGTTRAAAARASQPQRYCTCG